MSQVDDKPLTITGHILETDRGGLWLATRGAGERSLVRLVDRHLADLEFQSKVRQLRETLAQQSVPRVLPIVDDGFYGDHYCIEYRLAWRAESVTHCFSQSHWLQRLRFVRDIAGVYEQWRHCVPLPLGLHAGGLVACRVNSQWVAHLAACPHIPLASPYELLRTDPRVLSAVAPERIRHVSLTGLMEDIYAAGALTPQALGIRAPAPTGSDEERIEAQARGTLNGCDLETSAIEKSLWSIPLVRDRLTELKGVVLRCTAFSPEARPTDLRELNGALDRVLELGDACGFARQLIERQRPADALQLLEWAIAGGMVREGNEYPARMMAADLAKQLRMPSRELHYLRGVGGEPARRRRLEIQYDQYLQKPGAKASGPDPEGDQILAELERFRPTSFRGLDREERRQAKEDRLRAAMIYLRRGDLHGRAQELWAITEMDFEDIDALYLYGLSLSDLGVSAATMSQLADEAKRRVKKLKEIDFLDDDEVTLWTERFQVLRRR